MKEHTTTVNGVETTLLLSDEDAASYDEQGYQRKRAEGDKPSTKARKATENK